MATAGQPPICAACASVGSRCSAARLASDAARPFPAKCCTAAMPLVPWTKAVVRRNVRARRIRRAATRLAADDEARQRRFPSARPGGANLAAVWRAARIAAAGRGGAGADALAATLVRGTNSAELLAERLARRLRAPLSGRPIATHAAHGSRSSACRRSERPANVPRRVCGAARISFAGSPRSGGRRHSDDLFHLQLPLHEHSNKAGREHVAVVVAARTLRH